MYDDVDTAYWQLRQKLEMPALAIQQVIDGIHHSESLFFSGRVALESAVAKGTTEARGIAMRLVDSILVDLEIKLEAAQAVAEVTLRESDEYKAWSAQLVDTPLAAFD